MIFTAENCGQSFPGSYQENMRVALRFAHFTQSCGDEFFR
jgi:hypothetical protein